MWHSCQEAGLTEADLQLQGHLENVTQENIQFEFNSLHCHRKMMQEYYLLELFKNGSILVDAGQSDGKLIESYHCIDLVEYLDKIDSEPSVVVCDLPEEIGQLTKCCPRDKILDEDLSICVENPVPSTNNAGEELLPSRMMLDSGTYKPTGGYHLKISDFSDLCQGKQLPVIPEQFFTDGFLTTLVGDQFQMLEYGCADRVYKDGDVTDIVAIVCQEYVDMIVNKCCPFGETFVFDGEDDGQCYPTDYY